MNRQFILLLFVLTGLGVTLHALILEIIAGDIHWQTALFVFQFFCLSAVLLPRWVKNNKN